MILTDARIDLTTGYGTRGFTFAILGPDPADGSDPPERIQYENPVFLRDQANNYFQSGVVYRLTGEHPDFMPDTELVRVVFDEQGGYKTLSPGEDNAPKPTTTPGSGSGATPNLQVVTDVGLKTTNVIQTAGYERTKKNPVTAFRGVVVAVNKPSDSTLESFEVADLATILGTTTTPVVHDYRAEITNNGCKTISGYVVDLKNPNKPVSFNLYIDNNLVTLVTATLERSDVSTKYGLVNTTGNVYGWAVDIPVLYQDNLVHGLSIRTLGTGEVLYSASTPGNCKIGDNTPVPTFNIRGQFEELAPSTNNPPIFIGPFDDIYISEVGEKYAGMRGDEFQDPGDFLTYSSTAWVDGKPTPFQNGISFNPTTKLWTFPGDTPNTEFVIQVVATDSAGQKATGYRHVTIARPTGPATPFIVEKKVGGVNLTEGGEIGVFYVRHIMNTGPEQRYVGPGAFRLVEPYPNYMVFTPIQNSPGMATTRILDNTIDKDIPFTVEFVINNVVVASGTFTGYNLYNPTQPDPTPVKTVSSIELNGLDTFPEGDGLYLSGIATYSDGSTETNFSKFKHYIAAATGDFITNDFGLYNASGAQLNANGLLIAEKNDVIGDSRDVRIKIELGGKSSTKVIHIVDTTQNPNPPGTANCAGYSRLTTAQNNALPTVLIYEYYDANTSMGAGISYTVSPFSSRAEAVSLIPTQTRANSLARFDFNKCTSANLNVGDTLYNDNRLEHILPQTNFSYPVEAGFWGFNYVAPSPNATGSYVVVETNACGVIVSRETVPLFYN